MNPPSWLPLALALIGVAVTGFNTWRLRRAGVNPWVLPAGDDAGAYLGRSFTAVAALYAIILISAAVWPGRAVVILGFVPVMSNPPFAWLGTALLACGVGLAALGQYEMGGAWRVGIAEKAPPTLITSGAFALCRNPIFLGVLAAAGGISLTLPNALSFAAFAACLIGLSVHVRLEEAYLRTWLGKTYDDYAAKVPRWLPPINRK